MLLQEIPIRTKPGDARVGDVRRLLADTLQVPHGRSSSSCRHCADILPAPTLRCLPVQGLQLLGGTACLEDALSIAALGLEDIHAAWNVPT